MFRVIIFNFQHALRVCQEMRRLGQPIPSLIPVHPQWDDQQWNSVVVSVGKTLIKLKYYLIILS